MEMTETNIKEWIKCKENVVYFANKYVKINAINGITAIELNKAQLEIIDLFNNKRVEKEFPRQSGTTTAISIILLHEAIFNEGKISAVVGWKAESAYKIIENIREIHELLPIFLTQRYTAITKNNLCFENGSRITATGSSSLTSMRGRSVSTVVFDNVKITEEIKSHIMPTITHTVNSKIFVLWTVERVKEMIET